MIARTKSNLALAVLTVAFIAGCNTVTPPQQYNPGSFAADFANADGVPSYFTATNALAVQVGAEYSISATEATHQGTNEIDISGIPATVTTTTSSQSPTLNIRYYDATTNQDFEARSGSGFCSMTVTQTSPTLQGTFTGRLVSSGRADSIRAITSGNFNASF
ncbi:MAG: hypothetical protein Q8922_00630 [Bacteroidota bacterium]|nr:hypothetical protein [Bacteroidota bacterium]MDP4232537.1 hypothetical protein [Bacteroidota bacterium]MDP4241672.1 hypothetical protein [Bacteroidota bacterium]MDP4286417.1 hypothetical protein [Bacteroidota bacterium]